MYADKLLIKAVAEQRAGNFQKAESLHRQALRLRPGNGRILHFLGLCLHQQGKNEEGIRYMKESIEKVGPVPDFLNNLGVAFREAGQLENALDCFVKVIEQQPKDIAARNNLGNTLRLLGRPLDAIPHFHVAIDANPSVADLYCGMGVAYLYANDFDKASEALAKAIQLRPAYSDALAARAHLSLSKNDWATAEEYARRALLVDPNNAEALNNLGQALKKLGRVREAIGALRHAVRIKPRLAQAHNNLGNALMDANFVVEAEHAYRHAIALDADSAELHANLSLALAKRFKVEEAQKEYERATLLKPINNNAFWIALGRAQSILGKDKAAEESALKVLGEVPNQPDALINLGSSLLNQGRHVEGWKYYAQSIALTPQSPNALSNLLLMIHYISESSLQEIFDFSHDFGVRFATPPAELVKPPLNDKDPDRQLRIGYLSPDLRMHAVMFLVMPLLKHHDKDQFSIHLYNNSSDTDKISEFARGLGHAWTDVHALSDVELAEKIRSDKIDILIECAGHTAGNRLLAASLKPAPVQAMHFGYPDTTGIAAFNYRITDPQADPVGATQQYVEEPWRLPACSWSYDPLEEFPEPQLDRQPGEWLEMAMVNNILKLSENAMQAWAELLAAVPGARLTVLTRDATASSDYHVERLLSAGAKPEQVLLKSRLRRFDYLDFMNTVDLALDPFPYNGGVTTLDCLFMGLPVVCIRGNTHVSRVSASMLTEIGMGELIASDRQNLINIIGGFAQDRQRLAGLRRVIYDRFRTSSLGNGAKYTAMVETAYRDMWRRWCESPTA